MKKIHLLLLFTSMLLFLTACGNEVEQNHEKIIFEFPNEYYEYVPYSTIPNYVLNFPGDLYTVKDASLSNRKFFSKNDDFILSEIILAILKEYKEKDRLTTRLITQNEQFETRMNKLVINKSGVEKQESQIMKVKDGKIFNEISYINLENGFTLSLEYRRFESDFEGELKTYYAWTYTSPLNIVLHYPLILHLNENEEKEFLIVSLPPKVIYHIGISSQLPLNKLIERSDLLDENFRRFYYPDYSSNPSDNQEFDLEDNIRQIKDYYIRDFNGREDNGNFFFSFLGFDFKITFEEQSFLIDII